MFNVSLIRKTGTLTSKYLLPLSRHSITNSSFYYNISYNPYLYRPFTMDTSTTNSNTFNLRSIVRVLESIAPSTVAESWDNVGLLVEPSSIKTPINHVFLTNDLTEHVLEEAIEVCHPTGASNEEACLIVSYHPPIFKPLKRLTQSSAKERILIKAIECGIGIYSPHTSHDSLWGGVNDWILQAFNKGTITPLVITETDNTSIELYISKLPDVFTANKIGKYIATTIGFDIEDIGLCKEESLSSRGEMVSLKCCMKRSNLNVLVPKLTQEYPLYGLSIGPSMKVPQTGPGRLLKFDSPCPLDTIITQIKTHLKLPAIRVACPPAVADKDVSSIAVCVGSGASVLRGVKADLYLTGEMSHHDILEANSKGITVLLCEHSNTERGFLHVFKGLIEEKLPSNSNVKIIISKIDKDPVEIV